MFQNFNSKKTNLKAKKRSTSDDSKQIKLDYFFSKKISPNKENSKNSDVECLEKETSFECLSDVSCMQKNNSVSSKKSQIFQKEKKESILNSCPISPAFQGSKRKSRESPTKCKTENSFKSNFELLSSEKVESKVSSPLKKRINLNKSKDESKSSNISEDENKKYPEVKVLSPKNKIEHSNEITNEAKECQRKRKSDCCKVSLDKNPSSCKPLKKKWQRIGPREEVGKSSCAVSSLKKKIDQCKINSSQDILFEQTKKSSQGNSLNNISSKKSDVMIKDSLVQTLPTPVVEEYKTIAEDECSFVDDFNDSFDLEDWNVKGDAAHRELVLDVIKRCVIIDLYVAGSEKIITVQSCNEDGAQAVCKLRDAWSYTHLELNDVVNVTACQKNNEWIIDSQGGLLIRHPDILISGTSLMSSMFCRRRSVLASSYQVPGGDAKCMIIGSLVHLILQKVMKENIRSAVKVYEVIQDIISQSSFVHTMLLSCMDLKETEEELKSFVPQILQFMQTYVSPTLKCGVEKNWPGEITSIKDIEENIWSPTFGVKGKVDVTVEVKTNENIRIMPFELKTGKSSNSAEHRGQVILYVMMMAQLGYDVDSGLLFYLKDGTIKDVPVSYREKRDIIMLRNEFVHFIALSESVAFLKNGSIGAPILPPPIDHHSACKKCPYQTFCCAVLASEDMENVHRKNILRSLSVSTLSHLKHSHLQYVFHWIGLLKIEEADRKYRSNFSVKDLWCVSPENREKSGACIANLILKKVEAKGDQFMHHFKFQTKVITNSFVAGDYVVINTDNRVAIINGTISSITEESVILCLDKNLDVRNEKHFHMDRYESQTFFNFNLSNLSLLLEDSEHLAKLRKAIIELEVPLFKQAEFYDSKTILSRLNTGQKNAVLKAVAADTYLLIQGMPGCGKTETLAALVKLLVAHGQSVLITSHTHSAVDNLLLRLKDQTDVLRLGSKNKINPLIYNYSEENLLSKSSPKSLEEIQEFYKSKMVVAVTVLGCSHPIFTLRKFDVCLVDEATQVQQPSILRPLMYANKFILVGDPLQLPPLVHSSTASCLGLSESLFVRLNRPSTTVRLSTQYRMNKRIMSVANAFIYNGALKCGNESVAMNTLHFDKNVFKTSKYPSWLKSVLSENLEDSVIFLNIKNSEFDSGNNICINYAEAKLLIKVLEVLKKASLKEVAFTLNRKFDVISCIHSNCRTRQELQGGVIDDSIGIIAPYRAQVNLLRQLVSEISLDVEVNTVDQYQGRDKDIILFSCTVGSDSKETGILSSDNRLSVAITRAKQKLIFFGDIDVLKKYRTFEQLLKLVGDSNILKV